MRPSASPLSRFAAEPPGGVDLPEPVAGALLELVEQEVGELLLPFQLDLRDHPHRQEPAQMQDREADEDRVEEQQDRDVDVEGLPGRREGDERAEDDQAGIADGDPRQHRRAHAGRDQARDAGGDQQPPVGVGAGEEHDRDGGQEKPVGLRGQHDALHERRRHARVRTIDNF